LEFGEFAEGKFTSKNGEGDALATGKGDSFGRGESHLGRGMDGNLWADFSSQSNKSEILNDDGIDLGFSDPAKESFGFGKFGGEDQDIECEVSATATLVKIFHDFGKVRLGKVFRTETSIEGRETEIDGIGSGGNGSFEALPIACRG
jgi:hypothetical protein